MKHQKWLLYWLVLAFGLALVGCAEEATPSPAPPAATAEVKATAPPSDSNEAIVLDMVARLKAGDIDGSLDYFAEEAVTYFVGLPPTGMEFYPGREAIRPVWEYCVADNFDWEVQVTRVDGEFVYADTKTWLDFTRELGVAPNEFKDVFQIKDGKIVVYGSTITKAALTEFKPALAAVMPPEPTPDTSAETPGSELSFTFADHTCRYDGPAVLQAGTLKVNWNIEDLDREAYALTIFTLEEGNDMVDLMASTVNPGPPAWSSMVFYKELGPGESQSYDFSVKEGEVYVVCWSKPPDLPIGNFGPLEVVP